MGHILSADLVSWDDAVDSDSLIDDSGEPSMEHYPHDGIPLLKPSSRYSGWPLEAVLSELGLFIKPLRILYLSYDVVAFSTAVYPKETTETKSYSDPYYYTFNLLSCLASYQLPGKNRFPGLVTDPVPGQKYTQVVMDIYLQERYRLIFLTAPEFQCGPMSEKELTWLKFVASFRGSRKDIIRPQDLPHRWVKQPWV